MNKEAVEEMFHRRGQIEECIRLMKQTGVCQMHTPDGPVKMSALVQDAKFIDLMLMDELEDLPISGILINLAY